MSDPRNSRPRSLRVVNESILQCARCPELREYCTEIGRTRRRAFAGWKYWARPVPGFGDHRAKIMLVGLAPGAHGANRTGRMFTGDQSGDFLYAALHRAKLANQSESAHCEDGLKLRNVYITAALRCAPPGNKPTNAQLHNCLPYLIDDLRLLKPRVVLALGSIGWNAAMRSIEASGTAIPRPRPKFRHGAEAAVGSITLLGCYHVSQQNTFTGRLTEPMIDSILNRARQLAES